MALAISLVLCVVTILCRAYPPTEPADSNVTDFILCPEFDNIEHGIVKISNNGYDQIAEVSCEEGFSLDGSPNVYCIQGTWEKFPRPQCNKRCPPPLGVRNGSLELDQEKDEEGLYRKGTLAEYFCDDRFYLSPKESKYRVCEKGIWTGPYASCLPIAMITECPPPKTIANGYFVHERTGSLDGNTIGQRLHYNCKAGYFLVGTPVQQCLEDGTWSPKIPPICSSQGSVIAFPVDRYKWWDFFNPPICSVGPLETSWPASPRGEVMRSLEAKSEWGATGIKQYVTNCEWARTLTRMYQKEKREGRINK